VCAEVKAGFVLFINDQERAAAGFLPIDKVLEPSGWPKVAEIV